MALATSPRCPTCDEAMGPLFRRAGADSFVRIPDSFICAEHGTLAKGRGRAIFLSA